MKSKHVVEEDLSQFSGNKVFLSVAVSGGFGDHSLEHDVCLLDFFPLFIVVEQYSIVALACPATE
jgi:hypothetical protein